MRFWVDYVSGADWMLDEGQAPFPEDAAFVVLGDLNADPFDGDARRGALLDLLGHERVTDPLPASEGAAEAGTGQGRANANHEGEHANDTADWNDNSVGNLRVDYALPSSNLELVESGVFWPAPGDEQAALADVSDHHLVWVDIAITP